MSRGLLWRLLGSFAIPFSSICRDPYVRGWLQRMREHEPGLYRHSLRVGRLATDFYHFCGMEYTRGWNLIEGALLHDLGKICVPAAILIKPRELNEAEKRMVALHPLIGAELLEAQGYFGKPVINILRRHHERIDGSGYPDGWRKERTAKIVRVVAVCDALCAMTEQRSYEDAWPWAEALGRLKAMPEQYDGEVALILEAMTRERRTSIQLPDSMLAEMQRSSKRASGVARPRSAFYAPRARRGILCIQ